MDTLTPGTDRAPWAIKDFPVRLREEITRAARLQDCTVAEWLTRYFQRHGIDGRFDVVKINSVQPTLQLAELLAVAACDGLTQWIRRGAGRQVADRLGIAPPPTRIKASPNRKLLGSDSDAGTLGQGGVEDQSPRRESLERVADRGGQPATGRRSQSRLGEADQARDGAQPDDAGAAQSQPAVA